MSLPYYDDNIERALKSITNLVAQFDDEFEKDYKELTKWKDDALSLANERLKTQNNVNSPSNPSSTRKRKFRTGNAITEEQEDIQAPEKKRHLSLEGDDVKENTKPLANKLNHSTPNKDINEQSSLFVGEDVSIVTAADKPRTKRNASVLAAAMSNKMLNEKLNIKKRRPDSQNLSKVQEILLDQQPLDVLNNILKSNNKQHHLVIAQSSPFGKNGTVNKSNLHSSPIVISDNENDENQNEKTTTRSSRRTRKKVSDPQIVKETENVSAKSTGVVDDVDAAIMPPPLLPVIKKNPVRRARKKKTSDTILESDSDTSSNLSNSSTSLRTRSRRINCNKDESMETSTRSTRSNSCVEMLPPMEIPKRTRGRKAKEVIKEEETEAEPLVENVTKKSQRQTVADTSDSDEEFEKKKVKLRPKRTRNGKKQNQLPVIESGSSMENIPQTVESSGQKNQKTDNIQTEQSQNEVVPVRRTRSANQSAEAAEHAVAQSKPVSSVEKNTLAVEQKEPEASTVRRTRSSNRIAEMEEVSVTPKEPVNGNVVINETYIASPQVNKNAKKALNETVVIEKSADRGTIVLSTTPNNHGLPEPKDSNKKKNPVLNETITLSPKPNGHAVLLNETVTLQKGDIIQYDPEHSLLTDDLSEAEDTPPPLHTKLIPKFITQGIKKLKDVFVESPVKARVQQFERMAEAASPMKTVAIDAPTRVTRSKVRVKTTVKDATGQDDDNAEKEVQKSSVNPSTKKDRASHTKLQTPLSVKAMSQAKMPSAVSASKQFGSNARPGPASQKVSASVAAINSLLSPRVNNVPISQICQNKDDAIRKKDAMLQAISNEQRRKREEKYKAASLQREMQYKQKRAELEKLEKEKEEKLQQLKMEKEAEKKRLAKEKKLHEAEVKRKAEEAKREEAERTRKKLMMMDKENTKKLQELTKSKKPGSLSSSTNSLYHQQNRPPSFKKFEELATDDESEDEKSVKRVVPAWAKKEHRYEMMKIQYHVKSSVVDKMYSTTVFNPNLMEIFPQIDRRKLARTSSAVWKTPPRFSMMPKDYQ